MAACAQHPVERGPPEHGAIAGPRKSVLHRAVQEHWGTFVARRDEAGVPVPGFVDRELRAFLACCDLSRGFSRVKCATCGHETLLGFPCRGRGVCPTCTGRRMSATAAHLVDRVLPHDVPYRQWVLSLPFGLRRLLASNGELCSAVLGVFVRKVLAWLRRKARRIGATQPQPGAVASIQTVDGALRPALHYHVVFSDGAWSPTEDGGVTFYAVEPPTDRELARLVRRIARRVGRTLERLGYTADRLDDDEGDDHAALVAQADSAQGTLRLRIANLQPDEPAASARLCADFSGFSLHARTTVQAHDVDGLERLCRYILRPQLAADRLLERGDGTYIYELRKPWRDGTTAIYLDPMALMARLAALVVRPHFNCVRYFGCLASRSALRAAVIPPPPPPPPDQPDAPPPAARYIPWAALLRRVFGPSAPPLVCDHCGGNMRIIACVDDPAAILQILRHLGLPTTPITAAPARAPPGLFDDP